VTGYHLYVLYYAANTLANRRGHIIANVTQKANQLAAGGCNVTVAVKNIRVIAERSRDSHDVNLAMMDAYLDDGVDYFLLLFPHVRASDLHQLPSRSHSTVDVYC